ncbi:MAG: hypothetical protein P4L33_02530 [Capsulimonadaceae bacterium]|nr:hypothetical protein [Capsulimonadaceae bacterium]
MFNQQNPSLAAAVCWAVAALLAVSAFLRVWHLGNIPGLNGDEAWIGDTAIAIGRGHAVQWHTPNGALLDPFFYGPAALLNALFPPSIALLRSVAVVSGILGLIVNFFWCRRVLGLTDAIVTTAILAVLPESIAEGRLGWEPSQDILAVSLVIYLSLMIVKDRDRSVRWTLLTVLALFCAAIVHSVNIQVGWFLVTALAARWGTTALSAFRRKPLIASGWTLLAAGVLSVAFRKAAPAIAYAFYCFHSRPDAGFLLGFIRLFSGRTVLRELAGSCMPVAGSERFDAFDMLWCLPWVIVAAGIGLAFLRWRETSIIDRTIFSAWLLQIFSIALFAGGGYLVLGLDRYGLPLLVPSALVFARCVLFLIEPYAAYRAFAAAAGIAAGAAMLAFFGIAFFGHVIETGGPGGDVFQTGATEPKLAALRVVADACPAHATCYLMTNEFWTYYPIHYLASRTPNVKVLQFTYIPKDLLVDFSKACLDGRAWFAGDPDWQRYLESTFASQGISFTHTLVADYGGSPVLAVVHPLRPNFTAAPAR